MRVGTRSVGVVVDRPLRIALTALWASGAGLATATAVVAVRRDASGGAGYAAAAVVLALGALLTARGRRIITIIGLVACAGQLLAVAATTWELTHHVSHVQVQKLQALGVNPRVGVAINLAFSLCASLVAAWALWRGDGTGDRAA
jgi:purine-cytosine permease-like protein